MKKLILGLISLLLLSCVSTTTVPPQSQHTPQDSFQHAKEVFAHICESCLTDAVAIPRANSLAKIFISDRIVTFDPVGFRKLVLKFGREVEFVIFSHELGHGIDYIRGFRGSPWDWELSADRWSGCASAIGGIDPAVGQAMFESFTGGGSHPPGELRADAYMYGYEICSEE